MKNHDFLNFHNERERRNGEGGRGGEIRYCFRVNVKFIFMIIVIIALIITIIYFL